ncbi:hypothetical protein J2T12_003954 [Paenibacillus anaericanus]|uniref:superinfection exclusion B family protein n=1 Tax=Paenibacillus anaericanus TaxID=170367 RepID=UPI00277E8E0D|nr:superinfection exclusion B family protein [Paenibacillus anaericanus]MDQ0090531.1 hypothetical protein [Paenibacillus anaericanus]
MNIDFKISDLLNLPTTIMIALSLSSGIVLFSPESILKKMYMIDFRNEYGFVLGLVFIISLSILIVNLIYQTSKSISGKRARVNFYATAKIRLSKLNDYQKAIVYLLFSQDNRTFNLPLHDGAVLELNEKMIIGRATSTYFVEDLNNAVFPYLLQPWVSEALSDNTDLLSDFKLVYNNYSSDLA